MGLERFFWKAVLQVDPPWWVDVPMVVGIILRQASRGYGVLVKTPHLGIYRCERPYILSSPGLFLFDGIQQVSSRCQENSKDDPSEIFHRGA